MLDIINGIKSVKTAKNVYAALRAHYATCVSAKKFEHAEYMSKQSNATMYKEGGIGWWKQMCRGAAFRIVDNASVSARFIQPSPETLEWGGFLGGETVVITSEEKKAEATALVSELVRNAIDGNSKAQVRMAA